MSVRGITFSKQSVSSNDDSHLYKVLLNGRKGKTKGCTMTIGTDDIYIAPGYFIASNRLVEIPSTETISTPVITSGTTYCRLVFEIDLTKTNTSTQFNQGYFRVLSSTAGYPAITQQDLEDGGNVYQLPFARFTKNVSGIGSFVSELESVNISTGDMAIYVSKSGNDSLGDGSEVLPFATIQKAIDSVPKNLDGRTITINVSSGTYSEDLSVTGFHGGSLRFAFGSVTISSISIYESHVLLTGTSLNIAASGKTYGLYAHRGSSVIGQLPTTIIGAVNGLFVAYGSRFASKSAITINSCTFAVTSTFAAETYLGSVGGSKNNNGLKAEGGFLSYQNVDSAMASTLYVTSAGGRIYTGAQAGVPSY